MSESGDSTEQQELLRESALRARRLARSMIAAKDREKLFHYADELEQQALQLEQQGGGADMSPPRKQVQVQIQVQQQQQHETTLTPADDDPKSKDDLA